MTAALRENEIRPQVGPQEGFLSCQADIAVYGGEAFGGKQLDINTPIPTPTGWTTMGLLRDGDEVLTEGGKVCRVLKAHPIEQEPESYRLVFDDGTVINACADHLWFTYTAADIGGLFKRNDSWRAKRRADRKSRAKGNKSERFRKAISARNGANPPPTKPAPTGAIRTTQEIAQTLRSRRGKPNHYIPVCAATDLPNKVLPVEPYLLGVWLGDGTTVNGQITSADSEIFAAFEAAGYKLGKPQRKEGSKAVSMTPHGFVTKLRAAGVVGNKHVPPMYLRASREQRLALLRGLMDTDGYAGEDRVAFYSTRRCLVEAVRELACSIGHKPAQIIEKRAKLNGMDMGPCWMLQWSATDLVFSLPRKTNRQRTNVSAQRKYRTIVSCEKISPVPMRCITVDNPTGLYLASESFITTHNTYALLLDPLRWVNLRGFGAVIFRRNATDIIQEGGLWDEANGIYPGLGGRPRQSPRMDFRFPSGARISFSHLQDEEESLKGKQGGQIAVMCFDQLEHFTAKQFWYMFSRLRTSCGVKPYCRATCNPDPDSFVADLVAWWIDQNPSLPNGKPNPRYGMPIEERSGIIRWFIKTDDHIHWFGSETDAVDWQKVHGFPDANRHKSLTFIHATRHDNPIGLARNPGYEGSLDLLDRVNRARLKEGNWKIRATAGTCFKRHDFKVLEMDEWLKMQKEVTRTIRRWDFAGTEAKRTRSPKKMSAALVNDPDWTVGMKAAMLRNKDLVIIDVVRDRLKPGGVQDLVRRTAEADGRPVTVWIPQDPGQAGKDQVENYQKRVLAGGYVMRSELETGSKLARSEGYQSYVEHGHVYILRAPWNDVFLAEHEAFPSVGWHDDIVDCGSGCYRALAGKPPSTVEAMAAGRGR